MTPRKYSYILTLCFIIISCDLKSANDYLQASNELYNKRQFKEAIILLDKAIKKNPKFKEAYLNRGLCNENLNRIDSAINDYSKLLRFDPKNTTALFFIGSCKYRQNFFKPAIEYYNKALQTKGAPASMNDTSNVTVIIDLNKNGLLGDEAKYDIPSYQIFYARGLAYYQMGQMTQAYYDFEKCIADKYNLGESHYMIGLCWLSNNKKDKACHEFNQAILLGDTLAKIKSAEVCK